MVLLGTYGISHWTTRPSDTNECGLLPLCNGGRGCTGTIPVLMYNPADSTHDLTCHYVFSYFEQVDHALLLSTIEMGQVKTDKYNLFICRQFCSFRKPNRFCFSPTFSYIKSSPCTRHLRPQYQLQDFHSLYSQFLKWIHWRMVFLNRAKWRRRMIAMVCRKLPQ